MHNRKYTLLHSSVRNFFGIDLGKVGLTHNSLKTFVEDIFITGNFNVNNYASSVVNYSSEIDHVSESSSIGDLPP